MASVVQKSSSSSGFLAHIPSEASRKPRKSVDESHDNPLTTKSPGNTSSGKTRKSIDENHDNPLITNSPGNTSSGKTRKSVEEKHDNPLITKSTGNSSAGRVKRGDSKEVFLIPEKEKATESDVSAIDKLADIAKDKIQTLTQEITELQRRTLVSFPNRILTDLRNGLDELFELLLYMEACIEHTMELQEVIGAKEKEAQEMIRKVNFIASVLQSSAPVNIPIMNEYEVNACQGILKNVSASAKTHKTTVEYIKKTLDGCTGKLEKEFEDVGIQILRKSDGKFIPPAEFDQVVDSFMANLESRVQSSERQGNQQVLDLSVFVTVHAERIELLLELIHEMIQPLFGKFTETKDRVERKLIINALQIEEDYVSCKRAVEGKMPVI